MLRLSECQAWYEYMIVSGFPCHGFGRGSAVYLICQSGATPQVSHDLSALRVLENLEGNFVTVVGVTT